MKKFWFILIFIGFTSVIYFKASSNRLSFHKVHDGDLIANSDFQYKISKSNQSIQNYILAIVNVITKKETEIGSYLSDDFEVGEVSRLGKLFIIISIHTTGSGGYDYHQVFKLYKNNLVHVTDNMSCDQDVKIEGSQLIFTEYGFHCEYFDFFEKDGEITTSMVELK